MNDDTASTQAIALAQQCKPLLAGQGPEIQGAALAELVSLWISGHHPNLRPSVFAMWLELVDALNAMNARPASDFKDQSTRSPTL